MIFSKAENYGLDSKILQLQSAFQNDLPWFDIDGITDSDIEIYGKLYAQPDDRDRLILEAYKSGKEYTQIFVNDRVVSTIGFFPIPNRTVTDYKNVAEIDCICTANIEKLYPGTRDDEKILSQFLNVLREDGSVTDIPEVREGIRNVFSGFYFDNMKFNGMHPWYVFSARCEVEYFDNYCSGTV